MSIESSSSVPSDYPTEPPVGFRDLGSIDARIASLASKTIAHQDSAELAKLNDYRVTVMSFHEELQNWCDEIKKTSEYEHKLEAYKRIESCYARGESFLSLYNLNLTSLPKSLTYLKELKELDLSGNNFKKALMDLDTLPNLAKIKIDKHQYDIYLPPLNENVEVSSNPSNCYNLDLSDMKNFGQEEWKTFLDLHSEISEIRLPTTITDAGLAALASLNDLILLSLIGCKSITNAAKKAFKDSHFMCDVI